MPRNLWRIPLGLVLLVAAVLMLAALYVLLSPGMLLMAIFRVGTGIELAPSQMWTFSIILCVGALAALRATSPDKRKAASRYLGSCGAITILWLIARFGLQAPFALTAIEYFSFSGRDGEASSSTPEPSETFDPERGES